MRYAILSDIHANREALLAVLQRIAALGADATVCLGDIVGYNAEPNECIGIVRSEGIRCILGNHDSRAAGLEEPHDFNAVAAAAVLWTRAQLTEESRSFLADLPRELQIEDMLLVHGSIHDTDRYIMSKKDIQDNFRLLREMPEGPRTAFFGHTHVRTALVLSGRSVSVEQDEDLVLRDDRLYLINPGSTGQPRDSDPRASFALYDTDEQRVSFYRVEYDIAACRDKIIRAGLPQRLADRLALGR